MEILAPLMLALVVSIFLASCGRRLHGEERGGERRRRNLGWWSLGMRMLSERMESEQQTERLKEEMACDLQQSSYLVVGLLGD